MSAEENKLLIQRLYEEGSFRVSGEQIAAHAAVRDDLGMLFQLGLLKWPA